MQRLELYLPRIKVPRLNSIQDRILRQYALKKAQIEISLNKTIVQALNGQSKVDISPLWNSYVNLRYGLEDLNLKMEDTMRADYEKIRHLRPSLVKMADGTVAVTGLESLGRLIPHDS